MLPLLIMMVGARWREVWRGPLLLPLSIFFGQVAYSVWAGGDFEEHLEFANRYLTVGAPLAIAFLCAGLPEVKIAQARWRSGIVFLIAIGIVAILNARFFALNLESVFQLDWKEYRPMAAVRALTLLLLAVGWMGWRANTAADRTPRHRIVAVFLALFVSLNGYPLLDWARHSAPVADTDATMTVLGLELQKRVPPETVIAVVYAGSTPYWSRLPAVDLLGKSDAVIARSSPAGPFQPGHNKWDYRFSVTTYRPDLILQTFYFDLEDQQFVEGAGYQLLANGIYLDGQSTRVRAAHVEDIQPNMLHHHRWTD
jgi:hypothetical protein